MAELPLVFEEIKQVLMSRLGTHWDTGSRLPPIVELARELNTGQRNTLRAVNQLVKEGYLVSRRRRGTFVAQRAAAQEASPTAQAKGRIAMIRHKAVLPADSFIHVMWDSLVKNLNHAGLEHEIVQLGAKHYDLTKEQFGDFAGCAFVQPETYPIKIDPRRPTVVISTTGQVNVVSTEGYDLVSADEEQGSFLAGQRLRAVGCKSVAFVGASRIEHGSEYESISAARLRGFERGWGEMIPPAHRFIGRSHGEGSGARCVMDYQCLTHRPEGVFAASDELAMGFAMGSMAVGFEPGRDFQLIGFDAQLRGQSIADCPPLTSVAVPTEQMGQRGAELLCERLAKPDRHPQRVLLACSIYEGQTVRALQVA